MWGIGYNFYLPQRVKHVTSGIKVRNHAQLISHLVWFTLRLASCSPYANHTWLGITCIFHGYGSRIYCSYSIDVTDTIRRNKYDNSAPYTKRSQWYCSYCCSRASTASLSVEAYYTCWDIHWTVYMLEQLVHTSGNIQGIFQQSVMIVPCFDFVDTLSWVIKSLFNICIYKHWKKLFYMFWWLKLPITC